MPMKPRPESLNKPATLVTAKRPTTLRLLKCVVLPVRSDYLYAIVLQIIVKAIAVIGFIADQLLRLCFDHVEVEGQLNERDFMVICSMRSGRKRQTVAIHNTHDFHAFSAL